MGWLEFELDKRLPFQWFSPHHEAMSWHPSFSVATPFTVVHSWLRGSWFHDIHWSVSQHIGGGHGVFTSTTFSDIATLEVWYREIGLNVSTLSTVRSRLISCWSLASSRQRELNVVTPMSNVVLLKVGPSSSSYTNSNISVGSPWHNFVKLGLKMSKTKRKWLLILRTKNYGKYRKDS